MDLQAAKHHPGASSFLAIWIGFVNAHSISPIRRTGDPFQIQQSTSPPLDQTYKRRVFHFQSLAGSFENFQ
jgi:hypothetical protein